MIINPSALFQDVEAKRWSWIGIVPEMPHWNIVCKCQRPPITWQQPERIDISFNTTELNVSQLKKGDKTIAFWTGKCNKCGTLYWACDDWEWVSWLSDLQTVQTTLDAMPVSHSRYDYHSGVVIEMLATTLYFHRGQLEKVE